MNSLLNAEQRKAIEKLSSGLRVNRSSDDAVGIYISEKMRSQLRGLIMASKNSQDGISAVQTAEGAMNEVHSILQRIRQLAVQSANGTYLDYEDRETMQDEVNQLSEELERISEITEFNKIKLLNGSFKNKNLQVGANELQKLGLNINSFTLKDMGLQEEYEYQIIDDGTSKIAGSKGAPAKSARLELGISDVTGTGDQRILINIDGTTKNVVLQSGDSKNTIASKINTALDGLGTCKIEGNKLVIESTSKGRKSTVSVERLPKNQTTGGISIGTVNGIPGTMAIPGTAAKPSVLTVENLEDVGTNGYQDIKISFKSNTISKDFEIKLEAGLSKSKIASVINNKIKGYGTAKLVDNGAGGHNLVITTAFKGADTYVKIERLPFHSTTGGITSVSEVKGDPPTRAKSTVNLQNMGTTGTQDIKIKIDQIAYNITLKAGSTVDEIYTQINDKIKNVADVSLVGTNLTIISKKAGTSSNVIIEKIKNNTTGGINLTLGTVKEGKGIDKVNEVQAEKAKVIVGINPISDTGYQEYEISITNTTDADGTSTNTAPAGIDSAKSKTIYVKIDPQNGLTPDQNKEKILETINGAITGYGKAELSGDKKNIIITSDTYCENAKVIVRKLPMKNTGGVISSANNKGYAGSSAKTEIQLSDMTGDGYQEIDIQIDGVKINSTPIKLDPKSTSKDIADIMQKKYQDN